MKGNANMISDMMTKKDDIAIAPAITSKAAQYVVQLRDSETGGFIFAKGNKPTLMGTAYAIHALEFLDSLDLLSEREKSATSCFMMRGCREDGSFRDALFDPTRIATKQHDEAYFDGETTCFVQNALDALGADPPPKRRFPKDLLTETGLRREFGSYNWRDPHLNSNRVMFWMAQFAHEAERHGQTDLLDLMDLGLDWMDENQSLETGLWSGPERVSLSAAMAATFHYTFFYFYRNRPLLYPERIIDSCLQLQREDGLFSRNNDVGQTCLDYDALDLLAKASLITEYRLPDVEKAFKDAAQALLALGNADGGFANVKERRAGARRVPGHGPYHTGLEICSCDNTESNSFSTWFRLIAFFLCGQGSWAAMDSAEKLTCRFRRLPWLGYHDLAAIRRSYVAKVTKPQPINLNKSGTKDKKVWIGNNFDRDLRRRGNSYILPLPNNLRHFALKIRISTDNPLSIKASYRPAEKAHYTGTQSLLQKVENGVNTVFFVMGDEEINRDLLLEFFGEKNGGKIEDISLFQVAE